MGSANKMLESCLDDSAIVNGLLSGDDSVIHYFFHKKCSKTFNYIIDSVFNGNAEYNELVNELYLYISKDDWKKLRLFEYRSSLITWVSVVATRFFIKKRDALIENDSSETLLLKNDTPVSFALSTKIDIQRALQNMPNERYKMVLFRLYFDGISPTDLAKNMNINVENLYNIHRRALAQLKLHMGKKEDYYE